MKAKGTLGETLFVRYLAIEGWPTAERAALHGTGDRGDTTGHPGLCFEVKNAALLRLPKWLRETEVERINCSADYGVLVHKPRGVGAASMPNWHAYMYRGNLERLAVQAGGELFWHNVSGLQINPKGWLEHAGVSLRRAERAFGRSFLGAVSVAPKGVKDQDMYYALMGLGDMLHLLRRAGYGDEPVGTVLTARDI